MGWTWCSPWPAPTCARTCVEARRSVKPSHGLQKQTWASNPPVSSLPPPPTRPPALPASVVQGLAPAALRLPARQRRRTSWTYGQELQQRDSARTSAWRPPPACSTPGMTPPASPPTPASSSAPVMTPQSVADATPGLLSVPPSSGPPPLALRKKPSSCLVDIHILLVHCPVLKYSHPPLASPAPSPPCLFRDMAHMATPWTASLSVAGSTLAPPVSPSPLASGPPATPW